MLQQRAITKYALGGLIEDAISDEPSDKDKDHDKWRRAAAMRAARAVRKNFVTDGTAGEVAEIIYDGIGSCYASSDMTDQLYARFDFKLKKS
jgi:hypothetical protein